MDPKEKLPHDPLEGFFFHNIEVKQIFPHHPFHIVRVIVLVFIFGLVATVAGVTGYLLALSEPPPQKSQPQLQQVKPAQSAPPVTKPASASGKISTYGR